MRKEPHQPIIYREERLDGGWTIIHVLQSASVVGRITKNPRTGSYRYFPGEDNNLAFQFEQKDLTTLKQLIETVTAPR
jgi:hypothetical protein